MVIDNLASDAILAAVFEVEDPELPHVTIGDLGMVREVSVDESTRTATAVLTPTYTGCPATEQIQSDVAAAIEAAGYRPDVRITMTPAWSTDWITERGRERLRAVGITPPNAVDDPTLVIVDAPVPCPRCGSRRTRRIAQFGSTACKASYVCNACLEPFDYFKPL